MAAIDHEFWVKVTQVRWEAENVVSLAMAGRDGGDLPAWEPGAHLEITLPSGRIRHYSLCGQVPERSTYLVAVLREAAGRGGSVEVHETALVGRELRVRGPRNQFPLCPADQYMFVAGGIGITPVLSMMRQATEHGLPWVLYYGGRTIESMAFTREIRQLSQTAGAPVHLYPQDRSGLLPLSDIVAAVGAGGAVYACGPPVMLSALRAASRDRPEVPVHFELFSAPEAPADGPAGGPRDHERDFTVVLARTGDTVTVTNGVTILEAVREVRPEVPYSCEEGYCGTCEAKVLEGVPVHRDTVLTDDERAESASLMICVGSCGSKELVLDL